MSLSACRRKFDWWKPKRRLSVGAQIPQCYENRSKLLQVKSNVGLWSAGKNWEKSFRSRVVISRESNTEEIPQAREPNLSLIGGGQCSHHSDRSDSQNFEHSLKRLTRDKDAQQDYFCLVHYAAVSIALAWFVLKQGRTQTNLNDIKICLFQV